MDRSHTATPVAPRPIMSPYTWIALAAVGATLGFLLSLTSTPLPGAEQLTLEDGVDLACLLLFGVLGAELLRRGIAEGLGRALMLLGALEAVNYLLGGIGDALTNGQSPPPAAAQLCSLGSEVAFIATFVLLIYAPLALFPTGHLPSPRWRPLPWVPTAGVVAAAFSVFLTPGPVDEDNPATGQNPLGSDALEGLAGALEIAAAVLLFLTVAGGLAAFVVRWVQYRGPRRRQLAWFTAGVATMLIGLVTDNGGSLTVEVATALAIFGTLLFGMAWPLLGPLGREVVDSESSMLKPSASTGTATTMHE
jgi:hypothetical protein